MTRGVMTTPRPDWHRRLLVAAAGLGIIGWVAYAPRLARLRRPVLAFRDLPDLGPFRELVGTGTVLASTSVLTGHDKGHPEETWRSRIGEVRATLCASLFGNISEDVVPIASFLTTTAPTAASSTKS